MGHSGRHILQKMAMFYVTFTRARGIDHIHWVVDDPAKPLNADVIHEMLLRRNPHEPVVHRWLVSADILRLGDRRIHSLPVVVPGDVSLLPPRCLPCGVVIADGDFVVYIIQSRRKHDVCYIGSSLHLVTRLQHHTTGWVNLTSLDGLTPFTLFAVVVGFTDESAMASFEVQLQGDDPYFGSLARTHSRVQTMVRYSVGLRIIYAVGAVQ